MFITVDPGLMGTGVALWGEDRNGPIETLSLFYPQPESWVTRSAIYSKAIHNFILDLKSRNIFPDKVYIEYPQLMHTAKGMASADKGDVFKLTFLIGCFAQRCFDNNVEFVPLPVNEWKGNMPKNLVIKRIKERLGHCDFPNHVSDAVGMGLHLKGLLNLSGETRIRES